VSALFAALGALLAHQASHRAIDETEADWRHEYGGATTLRARLLVIMMTCGAIARLIVLSLPRETSLLSSGRLLWRTGAFLIPLVVLVQVQPAIRYFGEFDWSWTVRALLLLMPQAVPVVLPIALFYAIAWPTARRTPVLVVSLAAAAIVFVVVGWLVPETNSRFREAVFDMLIAQRGGTAPYTLTPEPTFWTALTLHDSRAWLMLVSTLSFPAIAAAMVPLAVAVADLDRRTRVASWCLFPPVFAASMFLGIVLRTFVQRIIPHSHVRSVIGHALMFAVVACVQVVISVWLHRRKARLYRAGAAELAPTREP
jgi:hypothetical protein